MSFKLFNFFRKMRKQAMGFGAAEDDCVKAQFQTLVRDLQDGVIIYNTDFRISFINKPAEEMLGVKSEDILGRDITPNLIQVPNLKSLTQIIFPTLAPLNVQLSERNSLQINEIQLEESSLRLRTVLSRVLDKKGNVLCFIKIIHNRTREEELLIAKKDFLNVTAHQLRTPLTSISWAFETIMKELESAPDFKSISDIAGEGLDVTKKLLKIINDLLNATRIEQGHFGYNFQAIDIVALLKNIKEQATLVAERADVEINFFTSLPSLTLRADPDRLAIVFSNLIDNAIQYNTKNGAVNIEIVLLSDSPFLKITVQDTGIGISQEEAGKIFSKFYRTKNAVSAQPDGSGLGLYISRNIIKNHGGDMGFESVLGRGTSFWFTLPTDPNLLPNKEMAYEVE